MQVLGSRRHSRVRRAGSEQRWPPALNQRPAGKNYTSQQAEGHRQPCKMESGFLGLAVTPGPQWEGGHRSGEATLLWEGGRLVFASVARPSFKSWNMLKDGLSELLFLVLFCFK